MNFDITEENRKQIKDAALVAAEKGGKDAVKVMKIFMDLLDEMWPGWFGEGAGGHVGDVANQTFADVGKALGVKIINPYE